MAQQKTVENKEQDLDVKLLGIFIKGGRKVDKVKYSVCKEFTTRI